MTTQLVIQSRGKVNCVHGDADPGKHGGVTGTCVLGGKVHVALTASELRRIDQDPEGAQDGDRDVEEREDRGDSHGPAPRRVALDQ